MTKEATPDAQYIGDAIIEAGEAIACAIENQRGFDPLDRGHDIAAMLELIASAVKGS